jgi:glycosyltransferase involved in cell wall biosynthesis
MRDAPAGRRLRVLALAPYPAAVPSTRFRILQMVPALEELGVDVSFHSFLPPDAYARARARGAPLARLASVIDAFTRLRAVLDRAEAFDAVLVQRALAPVLNRTLLGELTARGVAIVYDFDDAVYLPQEGGRRWLEAVRAPRRTTEALCRASAVVLAGNAHLADFAASVLGSYDRVRVVPSVVDTTRFRPREPPAPGGAPPTLGWVGSASTLRYLEALAPALRELAARVPHRLLVVAGAERPRLPGVALEYRGWRAEEEVACVQEMDVGLYPLTENAWTLGKCGFKAVEYLACAVPCVASPVGVLQDIVRDGETGLHARTAADWVDACAHLLADGGARAAMGHAGRALVERAYSVDVAAPRVAEALRDAVAAERARA